MLAGIFYKSFQDKVQSLYSLKTFDFLAFSGDKEKKTDVKWVNFRLNFEAFDKCLSYHFSSTAFLPVYLNILIQHLKKMYVKALTNIYKYLSQQKIYFMKKTTQTLGHSIPGTRLLWRKGSRQFAYRYKEKKKKRNNLIISTML